MLETQRKQKRWLELYPEQQSQFWSEDAQNLSERPVQKQTSEKNTGNRDVPKHAYCKNMLIQIHIDRFEHRKHGLIKKNNKITYPDQLFHDGQKYELYAVVVHDGDISREHYYSFVKVDDYDEWYVCDDTYVKPLGKNKKQHIHPDAYLLFYKKAELEPSLLFLNPLIVQWFIPLICHQ